MRLGDEVYLERFKEFKKEFVKENGRAPFRGELQVEDRPLYQALWERDLLDDVIPLEKCKHRRWDSKKRVERAFEEFKNNYEGELTRTSLQEADSGLYQAMRKFKLLRRIPIKRHEFGQLLLDKYERKCSHLLWNDFYCDDKWRGLYKGLKNKDLLDEAKKINREKMKKLGVIMEDGTLNLENYDGPVAWESD